MLGMAVGSRQQCQARRMWPQVQRLGSDVQQLEAESQRLLTNTEAAQPNGRSEASSCGGRPGGQAVHSLELLDFSPNWDFTLGGSKVLLPALCALLSLIAWLCQCQVCIALSCLELGILYPTLPGWWASSSRGLWSVQIFASAMQAWHAGMPTCLNDSSNLPHHVGFGHAP